MINSKYYHDSISKVHAGEQEVKSEFSLKSLKDLTLFSK